MWASSVFSDFHRNFVEIPTKFQRNFRNFRRFPEIPRVFRKSARHQTYELWIWELRSTAAPSAAAVRGRTAAERVRGSLADLRTSLPWGGGSRRVFLPPTPLITTVGDNFCANRCHIWNPWGSCEPEYAARLSRWDLLGGERKNVVFCEIR